MRAPAAANGMRAHTAGPNVASWYTTWFGARMGPTPPPTPAKVSVMRLSENRPRLHQLDGAKDQSTRGSGCAGHVRQVPPAPVQREPGDEGQGTPDAGRLAGQCEAGQNPRHHEGTFLPPGGGNHQGSDLQHHRQYIATQRRPRDPSGVGRDDRGGERGRQRPRRLEPPKGDEDHDQQPRGQDEAHELAGHEILAGDPRRLRVEQDRKRHPPSAAVVHPVEQRWVEGSFVRVLLETDPRALDVADLVPVLQVGYRQEQPPKDRNDSHGDESALHQAGQERPEDISRLQIRRFGGDGRAHVDHVRHHLVMWRA